MKTRASSSERLTDVAEWQRLSPADRERCELIWAAISTDDGGDTDRLSGVASVRQKLADAGVTATERQVYRYLAASRLQGITGLADRRQSHTSRGGVRVDPELALIVEKELANQLNASTGTRSRVIRKVRWEADQHQIEMPSTRTMYRLIDQIDRGRGSFSAATTRRSKAARPDRTYRPARPTRPGEVVEIDSTPLDVAAIMPDGTLGRPEITYAIDVATNTICGTLLTATATKAYDVGAILLGRILTPFMDRPDWGDYLSFVRHNFVEESATSFDWNEVASLMPNIVPESVTVDRGKVFVGSTFTAACERLEISQVRANPRQGTDKPHVEGGFKRIRDGFLQYLAGYTGGNVLNRGLAPELEAELRSADRESLLWF